MKTVDVPLADRTYPINIGSGILDDGIMIQRHIPGNNVLIVTNETIAPLYLDRCHSSGCSELDSNIQQAVNWI